MTERWTEEIRVEIEGLNGADAKQIRRTFKEIRQLVRTRGLDDWPTPELRKVFQEMKRHDRRDHVAALRQVYLLCLPPEARDKVRRDSVRRAGDPNA